MVNFTILSGKRFNQTDAEVQYVAGTGNAMPKDRATEILIEKIWYVAVREAKKRHVNIFNGKLFRLKNIAIANNTSLFLGLGDTDYKEYIATRTARFWRDHQFKELSNPLATCVAMVTSDGKIILEKRVNPKNAFASNKPLTKSSSCSRINRLPNNRSPQEEEQNYAKEFYHDASGKQS